MVPNLQIKTVKIRKRKTSYLGIFILILNRQKYPTPDDEDGAKAFYTSLYQQNPKS